MPTTIPHALAQRIEREYAQPSTPEVSKLKQTATQLEAVFLQQFLQAMEATVDRSDNPLGGGQAEDTFRGLMHQEVAGTMAATPGNGVGLARDVFAQAFRFLNLPAEAKAPEGTAPEPNPATHSTTGG
jgi:Rod binding domain-containing protein